MSKSNWKGTSGWSSIDDPTTVLNGKVLIANSGVNAVITLLAKYFSFNKKKVMNRIEKSAIRPFPSIPKIEEKSVPTCVKLKILNNSSSKLFSGFIR